MGFKTETENSSTGSDCHSERPGGGTTRCDGLGLPDCRGTVQSQNMPVALVLVGTYLPGYKAGGPIRSVANLVATLGSGFDFRIATMDRDLGDAKAYPGVEAGRWVGVGKARVMYQSSGLWGVWQMVRLLWGVDRETVLYLNSFLARRFSLLAVWMCWLGLCRPRSVVLAPRGEFSTGAIGIRSGRKRLYIRVANWMGWYDGVIWHASSEFEAADIRREFPDCCRDEAAVPSGFPHGRKTGLVAVASNLPTANLAEGARERSKPAGELRVVFVSRVSPKKNLKEALRALTGIGGSVTFSICGPREDRDYWVECERVIDELPANVRVEYMGEVAHEDVGRVFAEHDLFLFPTLGENYGHVICESLAAGCPVLISDRTPWRGLDALGVGWDLPLEEPERWREVLQRCVDMGEEEHRAMSERAMEYARKKIEDPEAVEANRRLFRIAFGEEAS